MVQAIDERAIEDERVAAEWRRRGRREYFRPRDAADPDCASRWVGVRSAGATPSRLRDDVVHGAESGVLGHAHDEAAAVETEDERHDLRVPRLALVGRQ